MRVGVLKVLVGKSFSKRIDRIMANVVDLCKRSRRNLADYVDIYKEV